MSDPYNSSFRNGGIKLMPKIYAELIRVGRKTLKDVPALMRDEVSIELKKVMKEQELESNA